MPHAKEGAAILLLSRFFQGVRAAPALPTSTRPLHRPEVIPAALARHVALDAAAVKLAAEAGRAERALHGAVWRDRGIDLGSAIAVLERPVHNPEHDQARRGAGPAVRLEARAGPAVRRRPPCRPSPAARAAPPAPAPAGPRTPRPARIARAPRRVSASAWRRRLQSPDARRQFQRLTPDTVRRGAPRNPPDRAACRSPRGAGR